VGLSGAGAAARVGESLVDEFDGSGVVAAVAAELAAKRVVELVDVDVDAVERLTGP
jgi:16S rRNA G1207 methylase RsmC